MAQTIKFKTTYNPDNVMTRLGEWCDGILSELDTITARYFSDDTWNDADQRERETMIKPACFALMMAHPKFTAKTWEKVLGWFERENAHTERKVLKQLLAQ